MKVFSDFRNIRLRKERILLSLNFFRNKEKDIEGNWYGVCKIRVREFVYNWYLKEK